MIHARFILRQITRSSRQAFVFILCVGMSIASLTAFNGLSASINQSLLKDAKRLQAADIIISSNDVISGRLEKTISNMVREGKVSLARYYEFYSVVRTFDETSSLLSQLKIVDKGYPFYGEVKLQSGRPFRNVLTPGSVIVGKSLLDRMGVSVGDNIRVGYTILKIRDIILSEPDRLLDVFSFGPRIFISSNDLERLGLLKAGSRVRYVSLLKVHDEKQLENIAGQLKNAALNDEEARERVDTYKTRNSRIKRFLDNFFFFLKLIGIFIMLISGVGIQSSLGALLKEKQYGIAIMKSMGATNRHITLHFLIIVFFLCLAGTGIGISAGGLLQFGLGRLLSPFLPPGTRLPIVWSVVLEGVFLGFAVAAIFTFIPLYRLREIRPIMIFREELSGTTKKRPIFLAGIILILFFSGLVLRHMKDFYFGIYFVLGVVGVFFMAYLLTRLLLFVLKRLRPSQLAFRQAIKGLFRQGSASNAIIITLVSSLCVVFSIYLIEQNLDATFVSSYPEDAPNVFILDIQPAQVEPFLKMMDQKPVMYPVIRARIVSINGEKINREEEHERHGDNLGRTFNLTYRNVLLDEEKIIRGETLFREDWKGPQVSILDDVMEMREIRINDIIRFNIQGVPLDARVSSIRTQKKESFSPFFYFVLQKEILKDAPQTIFSSLRIKEQAIPALQTRIVNKFPNVSVIDVAGSITIFASLLKRLSAIIRGLSALSIISGVLIILGSVFATRSERIIESVYYKILGAKKAFVFKVFTMENLIIASLSGSMALIIAHGTAYLICKNVFKISYHFFIFSSALMLGATLILIILIGIISSRPILMKKPVNYLRKRADE